MTASVAVPSAVADDLKDKKRHVEHSLKGAKADLEESSQAAVRANRALADAQAQLHRARARLSATRVELRSAKALDARMAAALAQAEQDLRRAEADLLAAQGRVKEQRATVGRTAAQSMQHADPQLVGLVALLNDDDPSSLGTQMQTVGNLMTQADTQLDALRRERTTMAVTERKVENAKDQVAERRKAAADNLTRQETLTRRAAAQAHSVQHLVSQRAAARRSAQRAKSSDLRQLAELKAEDDRIAAMLRARARRSTSFGNGGGALARPVPGYVTSPFGWRMHPIYHYWGLHDGTDFHAPCGTPLHASGNGRVVSEYFQSAWGNRLIIDLGRIKGHGVSVIYNHLSGYRAHVGDHVTRGEVVGYAGTTGWSTACHLHFTVMVDGVPKNPMTWF